MFWWDNFDRKIDRLGGGGSIHTTPGIAYQETVEGSRTENFTINIDRSKRRSLQIKESPAVRIHAIDPKVIPDRFDITTLDGDATMGEEDNYDDEEPTTQPETPESLLLTLWKLMRQAETSESIPRFVGFVTLLYQKNNLLSTNMTSITEHRTLITLFEISQNLAKQANMKYAHITLDLGAAINAFRVVWNDKARWSNVIIHLGDCHAFMAFFGSIGKLMTGSGFEEIVYQAGLCTSGSMTGLISGKHYNR